MLVNAKIFAVKAKTSFIHTTQGVHVRDTAVVDRVKGYNCLHAKQQTVA